ncbi:hypothetical protein QQS21_001088 [Conoideocrella luteorostrata]|uniref:Mitochondrial carrier protein pet8 n=1 Tax=Conoideocrella luteorostrata TaxID=1105319 RepID=A0AAJ0FYJ3_9HYPO|nr:hypothetical protein QQS21_001088 [Conoideocrella luteorostrata]
MFLARNLIGLHCLRAARVPVIRRGISLTTSSRLGLKETSSQTDTDFDEHKKDSLDKQKKGRGHWKPELASDSEEAVKADRLSKEDISKLQERTKRTAEESSKSGTSMKDGL